MIKITEAFLNIKGRRLLLVLGVFILWYLISYALNPYSSWFQVYKERNYLDMALDLGVTFIFCIILSECSIQIHKKLNRLLPWTGSPIKRAMAETILNIFFVLLFTYLEGYLLYGDMHIGKELSQSDLVNINQYIIVSILISLLFSVVNNGNFLIVNWKNSAVEALENKLIAVQHEQAAVESELSALKLQIDPHFVFNNLSVLSELILQDQQLGYDYCENFSKVYRYLLINAKRDMITLADELKFINAYIFLLKQRSGDGLVFNIEIDDQCKSMLIPTMTLQLLLENALKHNRTDKKDPLIISIETNKQNEIIIGNRIKPLTKKPFSAGLGLENIRKRYLLLGYEPPHIINDGEKFEVTIKLISYDH